MLIGFIGSYGSKMVLQLYCTDHYVSWCWSYGESTPTRKGHNYSNSLISHPSRTTNISSASLPCRRSGPGRRRNPSRCRTPGGTPCLPRRLGCADLLWRWVRRGRRSAQARATSRLRRRAFVLSIIRTRPRNPLTRRPLDGRYLRKWWHVILLSARVVVEPPRNGCTRRLS